MKIDKEYSTLFNGITDSLDIVDDACKHLRYAEQQISKAKELLKNAQISTEESYISKE